MEHDYGKEIDGLREQLCEIKSMLTTITAPQKDCAPGKPLKNIRPMNNMHPDKRLSELMSQLCEKVDGEGSTGAIIYMGVYSSGGRQSNWIRNHVETDGRGCCRRGHGDLLCKGRTGQTEKKGGQKDFVHIFYS